MIMMVQPLVVWMKLHYR